MEEDISAASKDKLCRGRPIALQSLEESSIASLSQSMLWTRMVDGIVEPKFLASSYFVGIEGTGSRICARQMEVSGIGPEPMKQNERGEFLDGETELITLISMAVSSM